MSQYNVTINFNDIVIYNNNKLSLILSNYDHTAETLVQKLNLSEDANIKILLIGVKVFLLIDNVYIKSLIMEDDYAYTLFNFMIEDGIFNYNNFKMYELNNDNDFNLLNLDELGIINGFTLKPYNFRRNYATDEEIEINLERLENTFEYTFALRMQPIQTHTNNVAIVDANNLNSTFDNTDGLITNLKGILLTSILADCTGFLLYDPVKKVIGSIHSGWKGTLGRICSNAIWYIYIPI